MRHSTVYRNNCLYTSHASACQAKNGDILVAFRQAPFEHIFAHVHPEASVGMVRSTDGGETWDEAAKTTIMTPEGETNLNDPSLTTLRDGTIILTAFVMPCPRSEHRGRWGDKALPVRGNDYFYVPTEHKILLSRSFDNGHTWDGPSVIDTSFYGDGSGGVFASVVETGDGSLLIPVTDTVHDKEESVAGLMRSQDCGRTWEPYSVIATWNRTPNQENSFGLPSVVAFDDDHLLAAGWSVIESGTMVSRSDDGGRTWSSAQSLDTRGACMHLCTTRSGAVLMTYGYRHSPFGIRVLPSYDRGSTWDLARTTMLRSDGAMRDLGYPWTIQLNDGRLLCVYYFNVDDADKSYYNEAESLRICRQWNLDPALYTYQKAGLRFIGATILTEDELGRKPEGPESSEGLQEVGPTLI